MNSTSTTQGVSEAAFTSEDSMTTTATAIDTTQTDTTVDATTTDTYTTDAVITTTTTEDVDYTTDAATETTTTWDEYTTTTDWNAIQETASTTEVPYSTETTTNAVLYTTSNPIVASSASISPSSNSIIDSTAAAGLPSATDLLATSTPTDLCTTSSCSQDNSNSLSISQIGGIVGGVCIFLIILGLFIFCKKERKHKDKENSRASQFLYRQDMSSPTTVVPQEENPTTILNMPDSTYSGHYVPTTSLYPRRDISPRTSFTMVDQSIGKSSIEVDTDNYTHSVMDIFNHPKNQQYRPSLNESILLHDPRRESTLDPHLLKKSLWDDQI